MTAVAMLRSFASCGRLRTKDWSIFSRATGKFFRALKLEIAGAEIIDRELNSGGLQLLHRRDGMMHVLHKQALGQLQLEVLRLQPTLSQGVFNPLDPAPLPKLARRDVYAD